MTMKRIHWITVNSFLGCVAWAAALQLSIPTPARVAVLLAPLLLLVAFGMYMFLLLVYGAVTFRSCPEEARALHADICRARNDLLGRGYRFDKELQAGHSHNE
ncbi:hypothetical protein COO60DRAFT_768964 [Scenedesmus sp. NREL 46B-D3]|nr:hypothetical protein COO60DRAFT_768964 [Scenedesmus sp. NREL 46B-D3]